MKRFLILPAVYLMFHSVNATATTCNNANDWISAICEFSAAEHQRCMNDQIAKLNFQAMCAKENTNCIDFEDGNSCFGDIPSDHWFVTLFGNGSIYRCKC